MQQEVAEERKVPSSNFPCWTEVIHPTQPVTPAGWTPPTLGELRWHCHSWSLGGRRAWHQQAEEHLNGYERGVWLDIIAGVLCAQSRVAPPPGFREVADCLMRDPPSPAPIEASPETRLPNVMVGPMVATLSAT